MRYFLSIVFAISFLMISPAMAQPGQGETLCVTDLIYMGQEKEDAWLGPGLSDMMIAALDQTSKYTLLDREALQEIQREKNLISGSMTEAALMKLGQAARVNFLLLGSYNRKEDSTIIIQMRMIRMTDQQEVMRAEWQGAEEDILTAPKQLAQDLLQGLQAPIDPDEMIRLEKLFPRNVDAAKAFYEGVTSFERGDYAAALANYLTSVRQDPLYLRAAQGVMEMYALAGRKEHSIIFAQGQAERLVKEGDIQHAAQFLFQAAQLAQQSEKREQAIDLLSQLINLADAYEKETGTAAKTHARISARLSQLRREKPQESGETFLSDPDIRYYIWTGNIESEMAYRERINHSYWIKRDGQWQEEPVPAPSVEMWKMAAHLARARLQVKGGKGEAGFKDYRAIVDTYAFLNDHPAFTVKDRLYWRDTLRTETHFMTLYHDKYHGSLLRDPVLTRKMIDVKNGLVIRRDYRQPVPDPRARVWSNRQDGGHEFFDFVAPEGYQIDSIKLITDAPGHLQVSVYHADPRGWPPDIDFSKRITKLPLSGGTKKQDIKVPPGNPVVSLSVLWGRRWAQPSFSDMLGLKQPPAGGQDIRAWRAEFKVSPRTNRHKVGGDTSRLSESDAKIIKHFGTGLGWKNASVIRPEGGTALESLPKDDVYAARWLTYAASGDIHIVRRDDPGIKVKLPSFINTAKHESEAQLVRMHDGQFALIWMRGQSSKPSGYFVAQTRDLRQWDKPRKLSFEDEAITAKRQRLWQAGIVRIAGGRYMMLLQNGTALYSTDLQHWSRAEKIIEADVRRAAVTIAEDGRYWLALAVAAERELRPGEAKSRAHGYYTTGDGKTYMKLEELHIYNSTDGLNWGTAEKVPAGPARSMLRAFPRSGKGVYFAQVHFGHQLSFIRAEAGSKPQPVSANTRVFVHDGSDIQFYEDSKEINCAVVVDDFAGQKKQVLLILNEGRRR